MFIGHYGPAVYDVVRSGKVKLWHAFLAVQAIDIVFCILVLLGLEGGSSIRDGQLVFDIDYSHSFVGAILIAFLAAGIYRVTHRGEKGSMRGFWIARYAHGGHFARRAKCSPPSAGSFCKIER